MMTHESTGNMQEKTFKTFEPQNEGWNSKQYAKG